MLDNEKDLLIKKELHKDQFISGKANDVFKNFEKEILKEQNEDKNKSFSGKLMKCTAVAASFVVAASVGASAALYGAGKNKPVNPDNIESSQYSSVNIKDKHNAADYITAEVINEEIVVEKAKEKKVCENDLIKAVLSDDGSVAVGIKKALLEEHLLKLDTSKLYKVYGIESNSVKDIFIGSMGRKKYPYVLMIMNDKTVNYVKIMDEDKLVQGISNYEFDLCNNGKIKGLNDIVRFEEKTEPIVNSEEEFYYINAITSDGIEKEINNLYQVNFDDVITTEVTFNSQDGENKYTIFANENSYVVASGWAGATNNVYYINDSCLYNMSLVNGKKKKIITGVSKIYKNENQDICVKLNKSYTMHRLDDYVKLEHFDGTILDMEEDEFNTENNLEQ